MAMQPGAGVPGDPVSPAAQLAPPERVKLALYYGINWGYTESAPQQAALAVWYVQDGVWHGSNHTTAEQISSAAASAQGSPSWSPDGRSAVQLAEAGRLTFSQIAFTPSAQSPAVGSGRLVVSNTYSQDLLVYLPYGTVFTGPNGPVLVWAVGAGAAPQPTATATQPAATPTEQPTATAQQATATPGNSKAPPAESTQPPVPPIAASPTPSQKAPPGDPGKGTPSPSPTAVVADTPTTAPTSTTAPTDTPTATTKPTDTPTTAPTSTAAPVATTAPVAPTAAVEKAKPAPEQKTEAQAKPQAKSSDAGKETVKSATSENSAKSGTSEAAAKDASVSAAGKQQPPSGPAEIAKAPIIQLSPTATRGKSASSDGKAAQVPPPVGTAQVQPPNPLNTAQAQPTGVPPAVLTIYPTSPRFPPTASAVQTSTDTPTVQATATTGFPDQGPPTNTPLSATSDDTGTGSVPTQETKEPTPTQESTKPAEPSPLPLPTGPVITTTSDDGTSATGGNNNGTADTGGTKTGSDQSPATNPDTGGGPSQLPLWLSISSALLVLGGWQIRRLGRKPTVKIILPARDR